MYRHRSINDEEVITAATLMDVVYKPLETIPKQIGDISLSNTISIKGTDLAIFTNVERNTIYVVFRGTSGLKDVITDIKYFPKKFLDTKAHKGFVDAVNLVIPKIIESINSLATNIHTARIFFCGHSLGGSLAQLLYYYANDNSHEIRAYISSMFCITEGAPKTFSGRHLTDTHEVFNDRAIRITHSDDVIPDLPPRTLLLRLMRTSYIHIGEHWDIGIADYEDGIREHYSDKYLATLKRRYE